MNAGTRYLPALGLAIATVALGWALVGAGQREPALFASPTIESAGPYSTDPDHIWNRVHRRLHVRVAPDGGEHGADEVDPLLWRETEYLLTEPSHPEAIRLLDEFLEAGAERLVTDPLQRAVFQHDLWAVFDWLAGSRYVHPDARRALMPRLARMIRRVSLTREAIERLPDTYAAAVASRRFPQQFDSAETSRVFLPPDVLNPDGSWFVVIATEPVAERHAAELTRSAFPSTGTCQVDGSPPGST